LSSWWAAGSPDSLGSNAADQVAVVVAGTVIGAIAVVVLLRIWLVAPLQTMPAEEPRAIQTPPHSPAATEFLAAKQMADRRSRRIRNIAKEAAALGPVKHPPF